MWLGGYDSKHRDIVAQPTDVNLLAPKYAQLRARFNKLSQTKTVGLACAQVFLQFRCCVQNVNVLVTERRSVEFAHKIRFV